MLVPLLGLGLEQPIGCNSNLVGTGGSLDLRCVRIPAPGGRVANAAFRIGSAASAIGGPTVPLIANLRVRRCPSRYTLGTTTPSPPTRRALDPNFRPNVIDSFDFTIQRQLNRRVTLEVGYIGRRITHEYQPVELNSVPYMLTMGGQQFKQAYANLVLQYCGGVQGLAGGGCGGASTTRSDLCDTTALL